MINYFTCLGFVAICSMLFWGSDSAFALADSTVLSSQFSLNNHQTNPEKNQLLSDFKGVCDVRASDPNCRE
ncbi:hypothetical protein PCC7424_3247 [Gloeothece citriformis PCC 7424]|uniref:Uncharacterized protein n=1 Tax=Gloeothece citriformis (strain PCC 7424) TaxID=65393 RepID=B7KCU6_GLOC7|nr:hypothetical protein [Gloeothece citriformis]ACK71647.1 hypothetical protein PCC7424_3247 [Gloeothece citriformis PCC 7424]